ncbi:MAG: hypothetical protein MI862_26695 [Desulfobacterales bacterium]|nr:hypothetical protein [Desulfobacterales bacterium]
MRTLLDANWIAQGSVLIKHYLKEEPETDMDRFFKQYASALFLEERQMDVMAAAISKALGEK